MILSTKQYIYQQWLEWLERENMPNIKITAEVGGRQVPLEFISTETFEAIKALEEPKEIMTSVAAIGHYRGRPEDRRLFLRINKSLRRIIADANIHTVAIELQNGNANNYWREDDPARKTLNNLYENIRPL